MNFHFEFLFALKSEMEIRKRIVSVVKEMIEILEYFKFEKSLKLHEFPRFWRYMEIAGKELFRKKDEFSFYKEIQIVLKIF